MEKAELFGDIKEWLKENNLQDHFEIIEQGDYYDPKVKCLFCGNKLSIDRRGLKKNIITLTKHLEGYKGYSYNILPCRNKEDGIKKREKNIDDFNEEIKDRLKLIEAEKEEIKKLELK
jgi:hypothetical protein